MRKVQLAELDILELFIRFCDEHDIVYYLIGGSLLGAVRHQGFIPWDDDIDVGLPRPDYDRFIELFNPSKSSSIRLVTYENTPECYRYWARIEDVRVTIVRDEWIEEEESHAWIDVFPLDGMPNRALGRRLHMFFILVRRAMVKLSVFSKWTSVDKPNRPWYESVLIWVGRHFPVESVLDTKKACRRFDRTVRRVPFEKSDYLINAFGAYKAREVFRKDVYLPSKMYRFEHLMARSSLNYDAILTQFYGDWRNPPDPSQMNQHAIREIRLNSEK